MRRSNMLIDGLEHYVTGEGRQSAPYGAFHNIGHCANVTVRNVVLTAHQGLTNGTIRNSSIGHAGLEVIGTGTLLLENTTIRAGSFVNLRQDYGSTWRGDLIIRNCIFQPTGNKNSPVILTGRNNGQHFHGYTAHMPERIIIDKLHIEDTNPPADYNGPAVLGNFSPPYKDPSFAQKFPYVKTREVTVSGVTTASGKPLRLSDNPVMFRDVVAKGFAN